MKCMYVLLPLMKQAMMQIFPTAFFPPKRLRLRASRFWPAQRKLIHIIEIIGIDGVTVALSKLYWGAVSPFGPVGALVNGAPTSRDFIPRLDVQLYG